MNASDEALSHEELMSAVDDDLTEASRRIARAKRRLGAANRKYGERLRPIQA